MHKMDESWRMRMGMGIGIGMHARNSMPEERHTRHFFHSDPDDFSDVFGGPPRTLLAKKFSGNFPTAATTTTTSSSSYSNFYSEVFLTPSPDFANPTRTSGRVLPAFRIPASEAAGFYSDVFASSDGRKSRERSRPKSTSSSVLSSEELSPLRPVDGEDVALSSFASKLRPINVPCRWNSTTVMQDEDRSKQKAACSGLPAFKTSGLYSSCTDKQQHNMENDQTQHNFRSSYHGFSSRHVSSPETLSVDPTSYRSMKVSVDDLELNSPSSPASSLCQEAEAEPEPEPKTGNKMQSKVMMMQEQEMEDDEDEDEDDVMSSYVIEINSDYREGNGEAVSIDEAIAWAKEKYHSHGSSSTLNEKDESAATTETERPNASEFSDRRIGGNGAIDSPIEETTIWRTEEAKQQDQQTEMEVLEEGIRVWSGGRETNIRLLLSSLHQVLWVNSGWNALPLTSLIESSHVKKAYQKARLCLHPDKLQQRGATPQQKYVAQKVFSILQDAWAAFISEDVFF